MSRAAACLAAMACALAAVATAHGAEVSPMPPAGVNREPSSFSRNPRPPAPKVEPAFSLKGRWVAVVSEDWRFRMIVPPKGDYTSVPLNVAARRIADQWDPEKDSASGNACKAYGVGNIMRMPLRLDISELPDGSWRIETDHGRQVRTLRFAPAAPSAERSWQGDSQARWVGNLLRVVTRNMKAGYLRTNGVPYSEDAVVTETIIHHAEGDGGEWFTVSTTVEDPTYLFEPFTTSSSFRRLADPKEWRPGPCVSAWGPLRKRDFPDPYAFP
jgi:hypothetical protein